MKRLPVIGVVGSHIDAHAELSEPLGRFIAESGYHLLVGGGQGIMAAVAKSFTACPNRKGLCVGVVPIEEKSELKDLTIFSNPYVELPIITKLSEAAVKTTTPLSLNNVNVLSSDVIIVLPGLKGTQKETSLALVYEKPVVFFGERSAFDGFPSKPIIASNIDEVRDFILKAFRSNPHAHHQVQKK